MATYSVLGATGKCGSAIAQQLLDSSPETTVHAYCRNAAKLRKIFPDAVETNRMAIFEGQIDNVGLFSECLRGSRAVFLAVTMNDNIPGVTVSQDTTNTVLAALKRLRIEGEAAMPKIIVLSSASLEPRLCRNLSPWFHWVVTHANSHVYEDLRVQERMLRAEADWLSSVFIKPGGLTVDVQRGHKLSLEDQDTFVSYADLAAAMIEVAHDPDNRYDMRDVSVNNVAGSAKFPKHLPFLVISGLLRCFFPWLHPFLPLFG